MFESDNIQKELESISPIVKFGLSGNLYSVPEDYFEVVTLKILSKLSTSTLNEVPDGYFNSFADSVLAKVKSETDLTASEELLTLSPFLSRIDKQNIFAIPSDYFKELSVSIPEEIKPAKVVRMKPFYKYAVAAVATGLLGLGIFNNLNQSKQKDLLNSDVYKTAYQILDNKNFDDILESVPVDEATAYLTAYGQDVNSALAALSAEDYQLDNPDELFLNENELDEFLKVNNIKAIN